MSVHSNRARWMCRLALGMTLTTALAACGSSGAASGSGSGGAVAASSPAPSVSAANAGGSPGAGGGSAAGTPDPCRVVTTADASQLTGKTLKKSGDAKAAAVRICTYSGGVTVIVTVARFPSVSKAQAQSSYNEAVRKFSAFPGVTLTHPGIGDKSLAGTFSAGGLTDTAIAVVKGNVYLSIQATTHVKMAALTALAVTALGRV